MKALILTGGLGTRLRPFTCDIPKPLLPVVNIPFIHYQLRDLRRQGIREVILATAYQPQAFRRALGTGRRLGLSLRYVHEAKPLGTGGAVRNALPWLEGTTLILNGDVLQELDVKAFLARHRRSRAEVSLTLVKVDDPSRYGLVETDADGRVLRFLEKPSPDESSYKTINAGAYLFETSAVALIPPGTPHSLERGLFPRLLEERRRLFAFGRSGYWVDFGTFAKYLQIHSDILDSTAPFPPRGLKQQGGFLLAPGVKLGSGVRRGGEGKVALGRATRVAAGVEFRGAVSVGESCRIGGGALLENCVVLRGTTVGKQAQLSGCVVGQDCRIGRHARVGPGRALGGGSVVREFSTL